MRLSRREFFPVVSHILSHTHCTESQGQLGHFAISVFGRSSMSGSRQCFAVALREFVGLGLNLRSSFSWGMNSPKGAADDIGFLQD